MRNLSRQKFVAWVTRGATIVLFLVTLAAMAQQAMTMGAEPLELESAMIIMAIPVALVFFALGLLLEVTEQEMLLHYLTRHARTALRWTPRIATLLFAAFVSMFALDVFGSGSGFWQTLLGLFMHLLPTLLLIAVLVVAWRWPLAGGVAFIAIAGLFVTQFGPGWGNDWTLYLLFVGPPLAIGMLFLANWWLRRELNDEGASPTPA